MQFKKFKVDVTYLIIVYILFFNNFTTLCTYVSGLLNNNKSYIMVRMQVNYNI